jgi:hypothetical protein
VASDGELYSSLRLGEPRVSSDTENKFEGAMEMPASSPLPKIAGVLLRFDHVAHLIVNVNHSVM